MLSKLVIFLFFAEPIDMNIRFTLLLAGVVALLQCISADRCFAQASSGACNNPIVVSSIIITNSTCGSSGGVVLLSLAGGNNGYTFAWQPNVSNSNVASGLDAAAYTIHIVRNSEPDCTLDTTVIVNNSNGPAVQVAEVSPSNCLAPNGKVVMSPQNFNYTWSNGEVGAVNTGLASGCYFVTATDPGTGCYSVLKVCVPNVNPLQSTFAVIEPAKCGLPTGSGQVTVTGGSGLYTYSFGNTSVASNLAPGVYTFHVVDDVTACLSTVVAVMTEGPLLGEVVIKPFNVKCAGAGKGNVEFEVIPGSNFKLPFTFALWDANGTSQPPGSLSAGTYFLQITDADGCSLPVDTFQISEPPAFSAQTSVSPETCAQGGQIQLTLNGGNGRYLVDWGDLPGFDNPEDRLNMKAGFYSATVYDSLFCAYPVGPVLVPGYCNFPDTLTLIVTAGNTGTLCLPTPAGVAASSLTYQVVAQNTPVFGSWSLNSTGCVTYQAGPVASFGVDPICVAVKSATPGLSDTVCVIVNITTLPAKTDSVYFAVQAGSSATACGAIPSNFINPAIDLLDGQGLSGTSDAFGVYSIDPHTACVTFQSFGQTGYNVDEIRVGVCDNVLRQCRVISYFPTVLSPNDCLDGIMLPDSLTLTTSDCNAGASVCLPVPFEQIFDYAILDNGVAYAGGQFAGCNQQATIVYSIKLNGGPYHLAEWTVNSQIFSGFFTDRYELLGLMNQFDPLPGWTLESDSVFVGGDVAKTYGSLKITSAQNLPIEASPGQRNTLFGTVMHFSTGQHTLIFRRVQTGCLDTVRVQVICTNCPPIHNYTPNNQGNIVWKISNCASDTVFCTNILGQKLSEYVITDNGQPFSSFSFCGSNAALRLDTGFHKLHILHTASFCEYNVRVLVNCTGGPVDSTLLAVPDVAGTLRNTPVEIVLIANDIIRGIVGNLNGLNKLELLSNPPNGTVFYDDVLGKVTYTPNDGFCGTDTFSYQITDTAGLRSTAQVTVTIVCDKVLVFTGISPNRDNKNDTWHIVGIEQFPNNEVRVFNRWGALVFEQKGYSNLNAWDGTWKGKDLPDGAYFYMLDLGDGSPVLSGYLQLLR